MSEFLARGFRAQLSTTMESVLRMAVFEIMKLFENSLHDHQIEMAHKGEEVAQLKIKLQRAEVKLREIECGGGGERGTVVNELQKEPEEVANASGQTSEVPEIDFEVPDDWCAPLGCETVTKQDYNVCPSVRLRSLYIPLWHVPVVKEEAVKRQIGSPQRNKGRFKKVSSLKERHKQTQDGSSTVRIRRPPVRDDMKKLLEDIRYDYADLSDRSAGLRRGRRNATGKEQENTLKIKKEEEKSTAPESKSKKRGEKKYFCKFCKKIFDTLLGRNEHLRSHKRCRGCKRDFPFISVLKRHEVSCTELKKLKKDTQSTEPPKPQSCKEEKRVTRSKTEEVIKKENTPSSSIQNESSTQKDGPTKKHSCVYCNKKFHVRCRLQEHMRVHTGERPFPCPICPKKFRINQSLKLHVMRIHKDHGNSGEINGELAWTKPLEVIEDNREDVTSTNEDTSQAVNHIKVQIQKNPEKKPRWQTMGTRCPDGFICRLCKKLVKNKRSLIKHFNTHKREKPLECGDGQLSIGKNRCPNPLIPCEKCGKRFPSRMKLDRHTFNLHREWPNKCNVCGKGFLTEGRLRNHMERH